MINKITFDAAPEEGVVNLGIGQPSPDLLPVDLVQEASRLFFAQAQPEDLNYGPRAGDPRFLESLAAYLSAGYRAPVEADSLFLTAGNSQALDLASSIFARPGDTIFVEEPTYFLAYQIFRDYGLNIVGIPTDDDGLDINILKARLEEQKPKLLYTIPSYHNPGGQCLSASRREELVNLSQQHDFLIVADEVYQFLNYGDLPPPAMGTMIDSKSVLSLGSFSKILAPGMRLGWVQTSAELRDALINKGFVNSGGSINHFTSHIVRHAMDQGLLDTHVEKLRMAYGSRVRTLNAALDEHFSDLGRWSQPEGGYFFWLKLHDDIDTSRFRDRARELGTGFQPGSVFSVQGQFKNCLRLSFAHYGEDSLRQAVARLRDVFLT